MDTIEKSKDAIERQFHEGVAEPDDPSEFLLKILGRTKDDPYESYPEDQIPEGQTLDSLRGKLPQRREEIQSAFVKINDIGATIAKIYTDECKELDFKPGIVRVYVIGGRVRQKPLQHSSDVDVIISVENDKQALQPHKDDNWEVQFKKIEARKKFFKRLETYFESEHLVERDAQGNSIGSLVEVKGGGFSESELRADWARDLRDEGTTKNAVLIYSRES